MPDSHALRHIKERPAPDDCRADSKLDVWEANGKPFFVLAQKGRFADLCYDHGRLLAAELEDGVFPEILATIAHDVDASRDLKTSLADRILGSFFNRLSRDVLRATSDEFRRGVEALERGYFAGLDDALFDGTAVAHACVAIDTGNVATGFDHIRKFRSGSKRYSRWRNYAVSARLWYRWGRSYGPDAESAVQEENAINDWLEGASGAGGLRRAGMGCTGFWAAPGLTSDGLGLHARNFDGAFFAWNRYPVLSLIDETPTNSAWQRYAAVGTAGLIYPGGISGMNEAGLAVSLHQMSTVNFTVGDGRGDFDLAPYVQQRILREARTLDEAVDIAGARKHFAAWTILVSHAPSGQALRIELSGSEDGKGDEVQRVEASPPADRMVQTNHFLADALKERHDFFKDAHFTKTVGKWAETRARFASAEAKLGQAIGQGALDTEHALALLADHADSALNGERRSFGRTICKAYSLMSSIARAHPDRAAGKDEIWFTLGESLPGPHSTLVGFQIDWARLSAKAAGQHKTETVPPEFLAAMQAYIEAFAIYERPQRPGVGYFRRRPTGQEMQGIRQAALDKLDDAVTKGEGAGVHEPVFRYIRARLAHEAALAQPEIDRDGGLDAAAQDWASLRSWAESGAVAMTDWERALIYILSAATEAAREERAQHSPGDLLNKGRTLLEKVAKDDFEPNALHQDIKAWRKVVAAIDSEAAHAELPEIDFVTVE